MFEHFHGDWAYAEPKFFDELSRKSFFQNLHFGPIRCVPKRFLKISIIYSQICILIWYFWVFFENYSVRMLNMRGNDFIACRAYAEPISSHTEHTRNEFPRMLNQRLNVNSFYMYNPCWAYVERILSHTEHTRNEFHRMLSICGTDFIACWAYVEMLKSRISRPNRIRFSKISCYRPLGPYGFGFCKKSQKKI